MQECIHQTRTSNNKLRCDDTKRRSSIDRDSQLPVGLHRQQRERERGKKGKERKININAKNIKHSANYHRPTLRIVMKNKSQTYDFVVSDIERS